jgi:hypothetical protein
LVSATAGIIAVIAVYYLSLIIFSGHRQRYRIALAAALMLAISPWHLQFSRAAFEVNLGLTCYILTATFYLYWLKSKTKHPLFLIATMISAVAAIYAYHSCRIVVPMMLLILTIAFRKQVFSRLKQVFILLLIAAALLSPTVVQLIRGSGAARFGSVSIFTNPGQYSRETERLTRAKTYSQSDAGVLKLLHNEKFTLMMIVARDYFEHFNLDFLFLAGDPNPRHSAAGMGLIYLADLPLLIYGAIALWRDKPKLAWIIPAWLLLGPLPASLATSTPHALRSLLTLPAYQLIAAYGLISLNDVISPKAKKLLKPAYLIFFIWNLAFYFNLYYVVSPYERSADWQYGYKQLVDYIKSSGQNYQHYVITTKYDQPHIYFAFYLPIDPAAYQPTAPDNSGAYGKFTFKKIEFREDVVAPHTLLAIDPEHTPREAKVFTTINFINGQPAFNLVDSDHAFN